jgi:DNA-directed RNA polymerase subunit RPC12/RpoP
MKIKCDKCGSLRVQRVRVDEPPPEKILSMEEYIEEERNPFHERLAVMVYSKKALQCMACGHRKEYISSP